MCIKYKETQIKRTFEIPFGKYGAWFVVSICGIVNSFVIVSLIITHPLNLLYIFLINIAIAIYYFIFRKYFNTDTDNDNKRIQNNNDTHNNDELFDDSDDFNHANMDQQITDAYKHNHTNTADTGVVA